MLNILLKYSSCNRHKKKIITINEKKILTKENALDPSSTNPHTNYRRHTSQQYYNRIGNFT